jgi:ABC-type multidrug transport system ATPase subunit
MAQPIASEAKRVREALRHSPIEGSAALIAFANDNAVTTKLKHEAVILKLSWIEARDGAERDEVDRQMLDLLERIVRDYQEHFDPAEASARGSELTNLREHFLAQKPPSTPVFVGEGLTKSFGSFELEGIDLTLRPGEITAVVGQNANGKTTLLRIVAGELRSDGGSLEYPAIAPGRKIDWVRVKSAVAYLPQELAPWAGSLRENLHYESAMHGILGEENEREVAFVIERLSLTDHLDKKWSELSGGYKLRFALARILCWKPKLLVVDEPLANLDVVAQLSLLQDIRDLARSFRNPIAVLISSQHLHELEAVATNIVFLRNGRAIFNGPVTAIGDDRRVNVYELGTATDAAQIRRALEGPAFLSLRFDGMSYVITTNRQVDAGQMLEQLLQAQIDIGYFRDVSRSTKRLFE